MRPPRPDGPDAQRRANLPGAGVCSSAGRRSRRLCRGRRPSGRYHVPDLAQQPDYSSIINRRHFDRLRGYLADARAKGATVTELNPAGESFDGNTCRLPPTLVAGVSDDMEVMLDEIFDPILPIRTRVLDRTRSLRRDGQRRDDPRLRGGASIRRRRALGHRRYYGKAGLPNFSHARSIYRQSKAGRPNTRCARPSASPCAPSWRRPSPAEGAAAASSPSVIGRARPGR
ncbi:aldehyde dehydrogenase family protein [Bradyrhizobium macuxiense]|uniref:Aldehyde dehydrogenase family protein n=1 Tax=Bradyrhizobium macuxiense TaxID=1755647 RepID=A0A560LIU6_9BRAD|nr:aldehyde dehydrogenase family protein [Bradyrhizobium macuxiense]TWB93190.1 aldehyde dehydrogenase family protein [Bradyrhizobium macuxiense]